MQIGNKYGRFSTVVRAGAHGHVTSARDGKRRHLDLIERKATPLPHYPQPPAGNEPDHPASPVGACCTSRRSSEQGVCWGSVLGREHVLPGGSGSRFRGVCAWTTELFAPNFAIVGTFPGRERGTRQRLVVGWPLVGDEPLLGPRIVGRSSRAEDLGWVANFERAWAEGRARCSADDWGLGGVIKRNGDDLRPEGGPDRGRASVWNELEAVAALVTQAQATMARVHEEMQALVATNEATRRMVE